MIVKIVEAFLDWFAVFLVVFITTALATFFVDPSPIEVMDKGVLMWRSGLIAIAVTVFYAAVTWLRRSGSTVPEDIADRLPSDPPSAGPNT